MAKKNIQRRKMAPRAVALLAVTGMLILMLCITLAGKRIRNNGRRYAQKLGEQIGMSMETAADAARVEFTTGSAYACVNRASGGVPYVFESPKSVEADGVTLPQWVIFCESVNSTLTSVTYYDYRQLERFGHGAKLRGHVDPAEIMTDMTPAHVQGHLGFLPLRRMYDADGLQEAYKYWYTDDAGTTYETILYVNYNAEGNAQSAAELKTEFILEELTVR